MIDVDGTFEDGELQALLFGEQHLDGALPHAGVGYDSPG